MNDPRRRRLLALAAVSLPVAIVLAAGVSGGSAYRYVSVFEEVWRHTRANYVEPVDDAALLAGAYRGMATALDGASAYIPAGEEKALRQPPAAGRPGLEVLPSGGGLGIVKVQAGGPGDRAGLKLGDQIWKIGGKSVRYQAWPQAKRRLSGPVGSKLDLTVLDGRTFKLRTVKVDLEAPKGPGYLIEGRSGVVYLRIDDPEFVDARALARDLAAQPAKDGAGQPAAAALLVDLRGTVGLDPIAIGRIAGAFFPGAAVLRLVQRSGVEETISAPEGAAPAGLTQRSVYALVDGSTAGAGEALAAVLKERGKAVVIGRSTYGLGSVPELIALTSGDHLLLGTREMRTTGGARWAEEGLEPDQVLTPLPTARAAADGSEDTLLDEALRVIGEVAARRPAA